jgi:uncharacterized integral membrane protein (TIGR00698 family)
MNKIYGLALCLVIALIATLLSQYFIIGSIAIAIIIGATIGNSFSLDEKFNAGITYGEKTLLAIAISLLGINLDFNVLLQLGLETIFLIILSLISTIIFGTYIAKKKNFETKFAQIISIGNGVCGSAAIAATKDIVKLEKEKSALAIAIINLLGTVGLFVLPIIAVLLDFSDIEIGILLGNTLQSVGHAVAAGFSVSDVAGQSATITKMGRILLLTPIIIWLVYTVSKTSINKTSKKIEIPSFIYGFIFFSILVSSGLLPGFIIESISWLSKFTLLLAMSAIGLKISFKTIKQTGWDSFVLASIIFKFQIIFSILLISLI